MPIHITTHITTLRFSPTLGAIDDTPLADFQHGREILAFREHLFHADGVPHLACVVEWRFPDSRPRAPSPSNVTQGGRPTAAVAAPNAAPEPSERVPSEKQKAQPDLRAQLSEPERLLFDQVRSWRADTAKREGVPAYLVLTNREVVRLIAKRPASATALTQIEGIGKAKVERYGADILRLLHPALQQVPSAADGADCVTGVEQGTP